MYNAQNNNDLNNNEMQNNSESQETFDQLLVPMVVVFSAAGLFVGIFGSISAIRKFMDV